MSVSALKEKITKSLEKMDEKSLNDVYIILKELAKQHEYSKPPAEKKIANQKIAKGIQQLNNGEGTDFRLFLNEMQSTYGKRK